MWILTYSPRPKLLLNPGRKEGRKEMQRYIFDTNRHRIISRHSGKYLKVRNGCVHITCDDGARRWMRVCNAKAFISPAHTLAARPNGPGGPRGPGGPGSPTFHDFSAAESSTQSCPTWYHTARNVCKILLLLTLVYLAFKFMLDADRIALQKVWAESMLPIVLHIRKQIKNTSTEWLQAAESPHKDLHISWSATISQASGFLKRSLPHWS
jgi:hypothetical protein